MANLTESSNFDAGVYQLETTDPVLGGSDGVSNLQAKQLANRTRWLKDQVDTLNGLKGTGIPTFSAANTYAAGQEVIYQKNIWRANTAIAAGAFNPTHWTRQLGTAAEKDAQTSINDTTAGALMAVGAFGVGSSNAAAGLGNWNDVPKVSGFYGVASGASNRPGGLPDGFYVLLVGAYDSSVAFAYHIATGRMFSIARSNAGAWSSAAEFASLLSPNFVGAPTATTGPQFDNGNRLATTEFVQRNGLVFRWGGGRGVSASVAIPASDMGGWCQAQAPGVTITLPQLSLVPPGATYTVIFSKPATVTAYGTEGITAPDSLTTANTYAGSAGDTATFVSDGTSWFVAMAGVIKSAGGWITQPQFSAETKVATTEFVQRALGNMSYWSSITGNTTLNASHVGRPLQIYGNGNFTITLPKASTCASGSVVTFVVSDAVTIATLQTQGGDIFTFGSPGQIKYGDTLQLVSNGMDSWWSFNGSAHAAKSTGMFGASSTANGYQKLPSGLVIQWGYNSASTSNSTNTIIFPIAFPNACHFVICQPQFAGSAIDAGYYNVISKTATQFVTSNTMTKYWIAIGY